MATPKKKKKKPRQKSKAAQVTEATRGERAGERWADRAEREKHPDRVDFQSRADQSTFEKREDTRTDEEIRAQSRKAYFLMAVIVFGSTAFLIYMFVAAGK